MHQCKIFYSPKTDFSRVEVFFQFSFLLLFGLVWLFVWFGFCVCVCGVFVAVWFLKKKNNYGNANSDNSVGIITRTVRLV